MIKTYNIHDDWTDLDETNDVMVLSEDGVVQGVWVNGTPAGGVTTRTITGTLANPFGDLDISELYTGIAQHNAFADLTMDASILGAGQVTMPLIASDSTARPFITTGAQVSSSGGAHNWSAFVLVWAYNTVISLFSALALMGGQTTDLAPYASNIPTTLTLYEVE